jgi:putative transposase
VLRLIGVHESTYYARKKRLSQQPKAQKKAVAVGRPIPEYSLTVDGRKVSDHQIEEWLTELAEGENMVTATEI